MWPSISDKYGRDISITVGTTRVPLALDSTTAAKHIERERQGYGFTARGPKEKMRLSIAHRWSGETEGPCWEDQTGPPLERRLREIAAAIVVFAEQAVRDSALSAHAWRVKRKAELEEAERKRKAEEERRRRERMAKLEKARADELENWSSWARAQADRIDPVVSSAFKTRPAEAPE